MGWACRRNSNMRRWLASSTAPYAKRASRATTSSRTMRSPKCTNKMWRTCRRKSWWKMRLSWRWRSQCRRNWKPRWSQSAKRVRRTRRRIRTLMRLTILLWKIRKSLPKSQPNKLKICKRRISQYHHNQRRNLQRRNKLPRKTARISPKWRSRSLISQLRLLRRPTIRNNRPTIRNNRRSRKSLLQMRRAQKMMLMPSWRPCWERSKGKKWTRKRKQRERRRKEKLLLSLLNQAQKSRRITRARRRARPNREEKRKQQSRSKIAGWNARCAQMCSPPRPSCLIT